MLFTRKYGYRYIKKNPSRPIALTIKENKTALVSSTLMFVGAGIISWVLWPILSFKLIDAPKFTRLLAPIPETKVDLAYAQEDGKRQEILADDGRDMVQSEKIDDTSVDYTKASNWFPQIQQEQTAEAGNSYTMAIPKLNIYGAEALVGGDDLNESLIHYGGTALPGEYGNAVIFGHSTLPYFYDPQKYSTIFSKLDKLTTGDEIFVNYDGLRYKYVVEEMFVVKPRDVQILEQRFDDSYVTLVTCVPFGTYLERLVVRARLQRI